MEVMFDVWYSMVLWVLTCGCVLTWEPDTCQEIAISSQQQERSRLFVRDGAGSPAVLRNVTLIHQISPTPCVEWINFGFSGYTIFVENQCGALFRVCFVSGIKTPQTPITFNTECTHIRLNSKEKVPDERFITQYVKGGDLIVSMDLLRQLSAASCVKGLSFNFYDRKVEARFGCRGDFRVCVDELIYLDSVIPDVKCEVFELRSQLDREERLAVPLTYGGIVSMVVLKEYSNSSCLLGKTFGYNANHGLEIYAKGGCQAEFDVCQSPENLMPPRARGEVI